MADKQKFAFDKTNFILLAIGMAVVIIGFILPLYLALFIPAVWEYLWE